MSTGDSFLILAVSPAGSWGGVEICVRLYRPRRARESPLFRLVEQHLEEFLRVSDERFAKQHCPLRSVVERVLRAISAFHTRTRRESDRLALGDELPSEASLEGNVDKR